MSALAKRRAYWLTRLMHEHGYTQTTGSAPPRLSWATLARDAGLEPRAGSQLLSEWAKLGSQPRDANLEAVSEALSVCPSKFHTPIPEVTP